MNGTAGKPTVESDVLRHREFIKWWTEVEPDLLRMAESLGLHDHARDIVQDVALLALRQRGRFLEFGEFQKWARARLYWFSLDEWGRRAKLTGDLEAVVATTGIKPVQEQLIVANELRRHIEELPVRQREAMKRSLEGHSAAEIARELKVAPSSVRSLLRFARRALFRQFTEGERQ